MAEFVRSEPIRFANVSTSAQADGKGDGSTAVSLSEYVNSQFDPTMSWADIEWMRANWSGPIALKGIQTVADAKIAEDLKKSGPAWESFQQTRYGALQRALGVVVNNPGIIALMSTPDPATGLPDANTVRDTLTQEQASSAQADFFVALDPQGHGIARTDRPLPFSADMSRVPTVAGALEDGVVQHRVEVHLVDLGRDLVELRLDVRHLLLEDHEALAGRTAPFHVRLQIVLAIFSSERPPT